MDKSNLPGTFKGSVDDLLDHCANLDVEENKKNIVESDKVLSIQHIMSEFECSEQEAQEIYNDICLIEVKQTVDKMVADGIMHIVGYNENNEPLFGLTELGKQIQKELEKDK